MKKGPDGRYHVVMSNTIIEFVLTQNAKTGFVGERTVSLKNFTINKPAPDSVYKGDPVVSLNANSHEPDSFWLAHRSPQLTESEAKVYSNIDSLTSLKSFRTFMDIATLLLAGYKSFGGYEVGPIILFTASIPWRVLGLGLAGEQHLNSTRTFTWKIMSLMVLKMKSGSISPRLLTRLTTIPFIRTRLITCASVTRRDTKIPGQELQFVVEDNFLLSFKRGKNDRWLYNDIFKAEYLREFGKDFSYNLAYKNWKQTPAGVITYLKPEGTGLTKVPDLTTSELSAELKCLHISNSTRGKGTAYPLLINIPFSGSGL